MLKCSGRSYLVWYTIILITSRDRNHITWFRNSASVSLLTTFSHRTWIASDFSSFQFFQKRSKISNCIFWKFSYKRKIFFLTHFLYAKSTFNNDRRLYKKKCRDLMRIWLFKSHWRLIHKLLSKNASICFHKLLSQSALINFHKLLSWMTLFDF
jgi:hypothetical protein